MATASKPKITPTAGAAPKKAMNQKKVKGAGGGYTAAPQPGKGKNESYETEVQSCASKLLEKLLAPEEATEAGQS